MLVIVPRLNLKLASCLGLNGLVPLQSFVFMSQSSDSINFRSDNPLLILVPRFELRLGSGLSTAELVPYYMSLTVDKPELRLNQLQVWCSSQDHTVLQDRFFWATDVTIFQKIWKSELFLKMEKDGRKRSKSCSSSCFKIFKILSLFFILVFFKLGHYLNRGIFSWMFSIYDLVRVMIF